MSWELTKREWMTHSDMTRWLRGKSVALVAPGGSLDLAEWGEEIDSYDIVARANGTWPKMYAPREGTRNDLWYVTRMKRGVRNHRRHRLTRGIQCLTISCQRERYRDAFLFVDVACPKRFTSIERAMRLRGLLPRHKRPTTGLCAINDLMRFPLRELKLFGFTFYRPEIDAYARNVVWDRHMRQRDKRIERWGWRCGGSHWHRVDLELEIFRRWLRRSRGKLKVDPILQELLCTTGKRQ